MMAVGCIQAQKCQTNHCPVGVATQDPRRYRALEVSDKGERVRRFQQATVAEAQQIIAAMGLEGPRALGPAMVMRRVDHQAVRTFAELYDYLKPGQLLAEPPESWAADWNAADPDRFGLAQVRVPSAR
jgi:hypothetical protein